MKQNEGGSGLGGLLSGLLSGLMGAFGYGGGKAGGGFVGPGRLYEVNERGAELLSVGGRDYLIWAPQGGT